MNTLKSNDLSGESIGCSETQTNPKTLVETGRMYMELKSDVVQSGTDPVVSYRTVEVNGLDIFYREAGLPTPLTPWPTSSRSSPKKSA
jgi:hypothetical protein